MSSTDGTTSFRNIEHILHSATVYRRSSGGWGRDTGKREGLCFISRENRRKLRNIPVSMNWFMRLSIF